MTEDKIVMNQTMIETKKRIAIEIPSLYSMRTAYFIHQ